MKTKTKIEDDNSNVNQKIKGDFVVREVKALFSYEMEAVLRASQNKQDKDYPLPTYDDIENLYQYQCPNCGEGVQNMDDLCIEVKGKQETQFKCLNCDYMADSQDDFESMPQEVFEWWIVTEYLYNKLKTRGEPVLDWGNNYYWGRCTMGQAILLDDVISSICREMEILDGQKYSWAKLSS